MKYFVFIFSVLFQLINSQVHAHYHPFNDSFEFGINNWYKNIVLTPTPKQPTRTAILIIAPPEISNCPIGYRWMLGKKVWEQYMNSHPDIDCYFLESTYPCPTKALNNQAWAEKNTIYVGDLWYEKHGTDRILHKTIAALELLLPYYTHFIRTNLNTFLSLPAVHDYMSTHHQSMYTTPLWQNEWYAVGYGIICTSDVAAHIVREYRRLESLEEPLIDCFHSDDCALISLATGVWPLTKRNPFRCCPSLPLGIRQIMSTDSVDVIPFNPYGAFLTPPISLESAINRSNQTPNTLMLYRIKGGLNLNELAQLYQHLLFKYYPELSQINLTEYIKSFP